MAINHDVPTHSMQQPHIKKNMTINPDQFNSQKIKVRFTMHAIAKQKQQSGEHSTAKNSSKVLKNMTINPTQCNTS